MTDYDYLLVGQGIAGSLLAHFLLKKGKRILIIDHYNPSSSSYVAAGILNPISGKRLVKTWKADTIIPFAEKTYQEMEQLLGSKFYFKKSIVRILSDTDEVNLFTKKSKYPEYRDYILPNSGYSDPKMPGEFEIVGAGYLDMANLVKELKKKFSQENMCIESLLDYGDLKPDKEFVYWKNKCFRKVIFCEGYKAAFNPFFSWLPFVLAKGEILTVHAEEFQFDKILMKDIFVLPLGDNYYKIGSTYQWHNLDENPTEEGKSELVNKLELLINCTYKIVDHSAGIRPTVKDRKPLIGLHPLYSNIGIFNGMGTKAATLVPFFADQFVKFLEEGKTLDEEVDIDRFKKAR